MEDQPLLLAQTHTRVKTMYASLHSNCAAVHNFSKNLGGEGNSLPFCSSLVTHEELRIVTCKNMFNHLVQAKCENKNPESFFQNDYHSAKAFHYMVPTSFLFECSTNTRQRKKAWYAYHCCSELSSHTIRPQVT